MSNNRIKVSGYAKKEVYNGNIEYRNFSPDLVGLQLTSDGGTPLFTMGNFAITTNLDPKTDKNFITNNFSDFISLSTLDLDETQVNTLLENNAGVFLNLDKTNLNYYAKFGSLTEFVRVSLENIIINWPASLYITPIRLDSNFQQIQGLTFENYSYNEINQESSFRVDNNFIKNVYNINYLKNGTLENTFNETNDLRNLTVNYQSYCVLLNNIEYDLVGFTGSTDITNDYLYLTVKGNPFSAAPQTTIYHIKPRKIYEEIFFNSLDEFEFYLLNRLTYPKYTATFTFPLKSDSGVLLYTSKSFTWPVTDGYNLDFDTGDYISYASNLLEIANTNDLTRSNLMTRFLVTESITGFDTLPYYLDDLHQDTSTGQKVNKLLNVYGRSFDDINKYISAISFANVVSYNKLDNMPDKYVKDLAGVLGWELISAIKDNNLLSNYVSTANSTYSGQSVGLTPVETDVEMWRRMILNSAWLWKSKGTRKAVEFLLRFIGTPNGLITFNEYVYKADNPIDVDLFRTVLELNGFEDDITDYPIDSDGYPRFFDDSDDMYFQNNGLWYRETSGANSIIDITTGNNPHIGPYDNGAKYLGQLRVLIPNFSAVTITSETVTTISLDLFTNYNSGEITSYSGDTFVDITNADGSDLDNCVLTETVIIDDPKPSPIISPCGCETNERDNSLSICVKSTTPISDDPCKNLAEPATISDNGNYVFNVYQYNPDGSLFSNNDETIFIGRECCSRLGGIAMYTEIGDSNLGVDTAEAGYACCVRGNCGCMLACNWTLNSTPILLPIGDPNPTEYCNFITLYGQGSNVVVSSDGSNCPVGWTTPVANVTDPHTGLVGFGCKVTPLGLQNYSTLVSLFADKANSAEENNTCCTYPFGLPPDNSSGPSTTGTTNPTNPTTTGTTGNGGNSGTTPTGMSYQLVGPYNTRIEACIAGNTLGPTFLGNAILTNFTNIGSVAYYTPLFSPAYLVSVPGWYSLADPIVGIYVSVRIDSNGVVVEQGGSCIGVGII